MGSHLSKAELLSVKNFEALMLNHQLTKTQPIHPSQNQILTHVTKKMKYSQACLLKKQVDGSINKLTKNLMGVNLTHTARMRLVVAHVSTFETRVLASANIRCRPTCGS